MSPLPMIHKTSLYRPPVMALPSSGHQIWGTSVPPSPSTLLVPSGDLVKLVYLRPPHTDTDIWWLKQAVRITVECFLVGNPFETDQLTHN